MAAARPPGRRRGPPSSSTRPVSARIPAPTTAAAAATAVAAIALLLRVPLAKAQLEFIPRNFSGEGNNLQNLEWGSAGTAQIRAIAGAEYAADGATPLEAGRPSAREVMTDVFLTSNAALAAKSTLFVAWGQLLTYDLALTKDNSSEPFDVPCNAADDAGSTDVWCPLGAASDDIPFFRSHATIGDDGVRSPINYASSYIDLDFVYGRTANEAAALRTGENGMMNVTENGVPYLNNDGTWLMADQRPARFPVTFALHIVLLLEHNHCCVEVATERGYVDDEEIFQACRGRTIAVFQHITENDFLIRLLGITVAELGLTESLGSDSSSFTSGWDADPYGVDGRRSKRGRRMTRALHDSQNYDETVNAAADVFAIAAGGAAFESALPGTVRIVSEGYVSMDDDMIELSSASADMAGLFERNEPIDVLRGAVLSSALYVDTYYSPIVSNLSPLFKLPVDAVQRSRDHGLPTYNAAREAYGLDPAASFLDVNPDADLAARLSAAYGGDIDSLDAFTGALAERTSASTGGVLGPLLVEAWSEQLTRSIAGDRFYHQHNREMENIANTTLNGVINRVMNATDLPLNVFQAPGITVCNGRCVGGGDGTAVLSDSYEVSWQDFGNDQLSITLRCKDIGTVGWMGIGLGGLTMSSAEDFVICELSDDSTATCTDRAYTTAREVPPLDDSGDTSLTVTEVLVNSGWSSVTFLRDKVPFDGQDYDLGKDVDARSDTQVIYAFREGEGIGQHPNGNRGAATVNFATGSVQTVCDDNNFVVVHGTLMLIAWMVLAPMGIYYVRYRKGDRINWAGWEWFEIHQEIMIVASELILPLAITAVFASGGAHGSQHAYWGYFLIAAVAVQIFSGFMRVKALEAKQANFSVAHRFNKHFHIWSGRVAYVAGVVQCYRGLELVSSEDTLLLSAGDGLDLEFGNYAWIGRIAFPVWFATVALLFVCLESRKQYRRYFSKGAANLCGCVELVNSDYAVKDGDEGKDDDVVEHRLVPRTEDLPIYTMNEFNEKVLHGQSWVLVDGAILDVSSFSHRHPGGARLILNALGTDVTSELLGEDLSVGHAMSFSPHVHPQHAWEIVKTLVVGYIEEDEAEEEEDGEGEAAEEEEMGEEKEGAETKGARGSVMSIAKSKSGRFRIVGKAIIMQARTSEMSKAKRRTSELATLPIDLPAIAAPSTGPTSTFAVTAGALGSTGSPSPAARSPMKRAWSSKKLLERFHVCPLVFREKMKPPRSLGRGSASTKRPVYRYVFSCPGQAQALVEAINGVCHFNMRAQDVGKGIIQRSYNAFAVRVQGLGQVAPADAAAAGGVGDRNKGAVAPRVIPARETTEGVLCIEMRIRIYQDGAMSQLLERLANDPDNPAVQLQGPFKIAKLTPPPAHKNVVMIAAGTGVNPMVQQIRDYLALPRSSRSRLSLVWQSVSEAELYGSDELTALQVKSKGLLEVTVLVSGDQRRRNIPGAAFRKGKKKLFDAAKAFASPAVSSPSSSIITMPPGRRPGSDAVDWISANEVGPAAVDVGITSDRSHQRPKGKETPATEDRREQIPLGRIRESLSPSRKPRRFARRTPSPVSPSERSELSDFGGGGFIRGKVTRDVLEKAFGPALLAALDDWRTNQSQRKSLGRMHLGGEGKHGEGKEGRGDEGEGEVDSLVGSDVVPGKLQVVLSGPSGFVFHVENILAEMGVPPAAIVLLD